MASSTHIYSAPIRGFVPNGNFSVKQKCNVAKCSRRMLSKPERLEYLRAVKCLFGLPSKGTAFFATRTRFDDFSATHINATTAFNPNDPGNSKI